MAMDMNYGLLDLLKQAPTTPSLPAGAATTFAGPVFGAIPGTPEGTEPTVELRRLYLSALQAQEQAERLRYEAEQQARLGNIQAAVQLAKQAGDLDIQHEDLKQKADQFSQTFGLQQQSDDWKRQIAFRQQGFEEQKFNTDQAANPRNLIASALQRGSRVSGNYPAGADSGYGESFAGAGQVRATGAAGTGITDVLGGAPGSGLSSGDQAVPVAGTIMDLLGRRRITGSGAGDQNQEGFLTSLNNLQNSGAFRLSPGNLDLSSLRNLDKNQRGFVDSTVSAQGQDPAAFWAEVQRGGTGQRRAGLLNALS